ncbi:MAG: hypothetical protein QOD93_2775, partial [Acetobacteraceae bacterium]|nr:hypothetical protein [Acetobacteraceae bacterium]
GSAARPSAGQNAAQNTAMIARPTACPCRAHHRATRSSVIVLIRFPQSPARPDVARRRQGGHDPAAAQALADAQVACWSRWQARMAGVSRMRGLPDSRIEAGLTIARPAIVGDATAAQLILIVTETLDPLVLYMHVARRWL